MPPGLGPIARLITYYAFAICVHCPGHDVVLLVIGSSRLAPVSPVGPAALELLASHLRPGTEYTFATMSDYCTHVLSPTGAHRPSWTRVFLRDAHRQRNARHKMAIARHEKWGCYHSWSAVAKTTSRALGKSPSGGLLAGEPVA